MSDIAVTAPESPARRNWMIGAVAAAAAAAGGGLAWWQHRPQGGDEAAIARLWDRSFDTPQGGSLAFAGFKGKPVLVNFWATWCPPCVEEMPLLDRFYRQHGAKGWQIIGLAVDQASAVRTFLQRSPVTFPIGLAGLEGTALTRALGNQSGGLPYSVMVAADGSVRQRRMGRVSDADLRDWSGLS
jgi:thiol-disulfide isomerase/thioredoxin